MVAAAAFCATFVQESHAVEWHWQAKTSKTCESLTDLRYELCILYTTYIVIYIDLDMIRYVYMYTHTHTLISTYILVYAKVEKTSDLA